MKANPVLTRVVCSKAPAPGGHCEQAILHGDTLHVSGQSGVGPDTPDAAAAGVEEQVEWALLAIETIARTVGATRADVVKTTLYIADISDWEAADRAYAAFFGDHRPARSVVPCGPLRHGAKLEIEAVVAVP